MKTLTVVLTAFGKYADSYTTYELANNTETIWDEFLTKFNTNDYVKIEGGLAKEACANESILYWKAKFKIEVLNTIPEKATIETKLIEHLTELQKTTDGGWYD
jgi:hypothetical protein